MNHFLSRTLMVTNERISSTANLRDISSHLSRLIEYTVYPEHFRQRLGTFIAGWHMLDVTDKTWILPQAQWLHLHIHLLQF